MIATKNFGFLASKPFFKFNLIFGPAEGNLYSLSQEKRYKDLSLYNAISYFAREFLLDLKSIKTEKDVIEALKHKTEFERDILVTTFRIPEGKISTYKRIAEKIGRPKAYRAVANALHKNPLWPVVPCHRVVCSDGSFGGSEKGADARRNTLATEGVPIKNGKVTVSDEILC